MFRSKSNTLSPPLSLSMAILSQSSSNWMLSLKVVLITTSVLFMAMVLKLSVPIVMEFAISEIPSIWSFVMSWLRPPYLYVVINCIIITIVASSKLQQKVIDKPPPAVAAETKVNPVPIKVRADYAVAYGGVDVKNASVEVRPEFEYGYDANVVKGSEFDVYELEDDRLPEIETKTATTTLAIRAAQEMSGEELALSRSLWTPQLNSREYALSSSEKPTVSVRIGHRKAVKSSPEGGRTLRVAKPKRQETLESTWKTITEGRSMPLTRHLRKSDTWETHGRVAHLQEDHILIIICRCSDVDSHFGICLNNNFLICHCNGWLCSGGRTLRVAKPKRQETLESTWKTITEGRSMPLTRHLRKSDTWETHGRVAHLQEDHDQRMTKSETFNHTTTANSSPKQSSPGPMRLRREPSGSGKLRKEPSLSQDDLNRRVEAFINKFNEEMRLQRQESLNKYMEMINRGVH
ncbi:uncharacterized protein LOC114324042 [Camellia sinensis]|uniref:uncharacterized protein LOC114324042 n=1 Tax=Camellia sinensis TaxID=4442 RepID=UPI001035F292|nr:uncharacterized protein LOC114324042 [Camellia sinensis]